MPAEIPTKPLSTLPVKAEGETFDRFHPEMPQIPGVVGARSPSTAKPFPMDRQRIIQLVGAAAGVVVIIVAIFWWIKSVPRKAAGAASSQAAVTESPVPELPPTAHIPAAPSGPAAAATVEELSKPWSAKKFIFVKPTTNENVNAMVIRLPGGGLWAFALQEPYGRCELEFVTDIGQLATKYDYRASHPMVVNPCNRTVYDPLK